MSSFTDRAGTDGYSTSTMQQQRAAICRLPRGKFIGQHACCSRAAINDHLLRQRVTQPLRDRARGNISAPAH